MKRFLLLAALVISATASAGVLRAATAQHGGYLDVFVRSTTETSFQVSGWAYNPNAPAHDVVIDVFIDGVRAFSLAPEAYRADVVAYTGVEQTYGFVFDLPTNAFTCTGLDECTDTHRVEFVSRDLTTGETFALSGGVQSVTPETVGVIGYIDRMSVENAQDPQVFVRGWVADAEYRSLSRDVFVMMDGELVGMGTADISRNDVEAIYGVTEKTGFAVPIGSPSEVTEGQVAQVFVYDDNTNQFVRIDGVAYSGE